MHTLARKWEDPKGKRKNNPMVKTPISFYCRTKPGFALFKSKLDGRLLQRAAKPSPYINQEHGSNFDFRVNSVFSFLYG